MLAPASQVGDPDEVPGCWLSLAQPWFLQEWTSRCKIISISILFSSSPPSLFPSFHASSKKKKCGVHLRSSFVIQPTQRPLNKHISIIWTAIFSHTSANIHLTTFWCGIFPNFTCVSNKTVRLGDKFYPCSLIKWEHSDNWEKKQYQENNLKYFLK